ncbi:MAG: hypothetical protein C4537_02625 [Acholeplasma sp.]|nr:MAG: hypothetical protein C4537_02625 [Acholeplasma sp.]
MKKIYVIGLLITIGLIGLRIVFLREFISVSFIAREVLVGLLFAHIYLGLSYAGMNLIRLIFQEWFAELRIIGFWLSNIGFTGYLAYSYIKTIHMNHWICSALSGFAMIIIGLMLDYHQQNVIEYKIDKNAKEIKDEDFKIQFK